MVPPPEDDRPRASTVRHLRKMMAAAAAIGVAAVTSRSASGRSETYDVSITPDAARPDTSVVDVDGGDPDGMSQGIAPPCTPNTPNCGYMVVDPIPEPANRGCGCGKLPGSS